MATVNFSHSAVTASTRRFNADALAFLQAGAEFSRHRCERAIAAHDCSLAHCPFAPTTQSPGAAGTPLGEQGDLAIGQHFDLAGDPVATREFTVAPAA